MDVIKQGQAGCDHRLITVTVISATILAYVLVVCSLGMKSHRADGVLVVLAAAVLLYITMARPLPMRENYADPAPANATTTTTTTTTSTSLDKILSIIGIQNGAAQDVQATANSIATLSSDYNENLQPLSASLTLYYSAFSARCYPKNGRTWYNIAPFFSTPASTCPDVRLDDTHMQFSQSVTYSRENGFSIGSITLSGPRAFQMGLSGNASFTLFMCVRFMALDTAQNDPGQSYDLLRIPANTTNNNGLTISFAPQVTTVGSQYATKLVVQYGSQVMQATDPDTSSNMIMINPSYTYMLVLVKNTLDISLVLYPNIDNIGSSAPMGVRIIRQWRVDATEDVLFSNKEMTINGSGNIHANLYSFGAYNTALDESRTTLLFNHTQAELQKSNQLLQSLAAQIASLQQAVDTAKQCPYSAQVCDACPSIKDWTNPTNIIASGDDKCMSMIDAYCTSNPKSDLCACWNPNNTLSHTSECKNYVNIFRKGEITATALEEIKEKHNLCSCDAGALVPASGQQGVQESQSPMQAQRKRARATRALAVDAKYGIDADDLRAYNSLDIIHFYDSGAPSASTMDAHLLIDNPYP